MEEEETFCGIPPLACFWWKDEILKDSFEGLKWLLAGIFINLIKHGERERERERLPAFLPCKIGELGLNAVQWALLLYMFIIFLNIQNRSVSAKLPNMFIVYVAQDHESCMLLGWGYPWIIALYIWQWQLLFS